LSQEEICPQGEIEAGPNGTRRMTSSMRPDKRG
jgi:hypothetical protein